MKMNGKHDNDNDLIIFHLLSLLISCGEPLRDLQYTSYWLKDIYPEVTRIT